MTNMALRNFFFWSFVVNFSLLLFWAGVFLLARGWIYRLHGRFFRISEENFSAIHYCGMAFYKILIIVFNVVPYIALRIAG